MDTRESKMLNDRESSIPNTGHFTLALSFTVKCTNLTRYICLHYKSQHCYLTLHFVRDSYLIPFQLEKRKVGEWSFSNVRPRLWKFNALSIAMLGNDYEMHYPLQCWVTLMECTTHCNVGQRLWNALPIAMLGHAYGMHYPLQCWATLMQCTAKCQRSNNSIQLSWNEMKF